MAGIGYDPNRFINPVDEDLICSLCDRVFRNPRCLLCQHTYCKSCIEASLAKIAKCPICQMPVLNSFSIFAAPRIVRNILSRLELRCSKECSDSFQLAKIDKHEAICSRIITCPVGNCSESEVKLSKMTDHLRIHEEVDELLSTIKRLSTEIEVIKDEKQEDGTDLKGEVSLIRKKGFLSWHCWSYEPTTEIQPALQEELLECVRKGNLDQVTSLVCNQKADVNMRTDQKDESSNTYLQEAISLGNENMAILLLQCGSNPNLVTKGNTAIHCAAREGWPDTLDLALALSKQHSFPEIGTKPSEITAQRSKMDFFNHPTVSSTCSSSSKLHFSSSHPSNHPVVPATSNSSSTPTPSKHSAIFATGGNPFEYLTSFSSTPLPLNPPAFSGFSFPSTTPTPSALPATSLKPSQFSFSSTTSPSKHPTVESTSYIIQPVVNFRNRDGDTALHLATKTGSVECVQVLLKHGADREIANNVKQVARTIARGSGFNEIYILLGGTSKAMSND